MNRSFHQELQKIGENRYRTAVLAHELGHAQDYEGSSVPRLRTAARVLGPAIGAISGLALVSANKPGAAAAAVASGFIPTLVDEALATHGGLNALKHLEKYSPKQRSKMRNQLLKAFGTYGLSTATTAGAIAALPLARNNLESRAIVSGIIAAGTLANLGLLLSAKHGLKKSPTSGESSTNKLRESLGVKAGVHEGQDQGWGELGAFYASKPTGKISKFLTKLEVLPHLANKKDIHKILREGGVVMAKSASADRQRQLDRQKRVRRIIVGLGLLGPVASVGLAVRHRKQIAQAFKGGSR